MVCDMGVRIQRETGAVVSQHTGHRFHVGTGLQSQGREGMSQVMEANPFVDASRSQDFLMQTSTASGLHISPVCGDGNRYLLSG